MSYYAHSAGEAGESQVLSAHLWQVARLASAFAESFKCSGAALALGLLHDVGKYHPDFQHYLKTSQLGGAARKRGPDHKMAGTLLATQRGLGLAALAVQGHHGGLTSVADLKAWLSDAALRAEAEKAMHLALLDMPEMANMPAPGWPDNINDPYYAETLIRFLYSALVDADYLDTAAHFHPYAERPTQPLGGLWERFVAHHDSFGAARSQVDQVRSEIYEHCLAAATQPPGLFRLAVPTGGGKTLSGMAFALKHALEHGLRRVVVAVPYISITEQTAEVYRTVFGSQAVLEHHSQAQEVGEDAWARLGAENWDAPIIVTTTVQLLESLFANKPQRARKVHRLAGSVIILDEVQSLPVHLLDPTLDMLKRLTTGFGATVVFSTATQPAFDLIPTFRDPAIRDIVPEAQRYYAGLQRVRYEVRGESDWPELAAEMRQQKQALAIVNTKRDAMTMLGALEELGQQPLHLSTQLCGAHRRAVLATVKERLDAGRPCLLVATQVVEAGVDIDFPIVFRAMGPLDAIIQAAGRCNREGRLSEGRVVVFEPKEGHTAPGFYRTATDEARTILALGVDLNTLEGVRPYYERLYRDVDTDARGIQALRKRLDYPEVAHRFRLIDDDSVSVVVASYERREWIEQQVEALAGHRGSPRQIMRELQPYIVNVYRHHAGEYVNRGLLAEVNPGLYWWNGQYDGIRGLVSLPNDAASFVI